MKRTDVLASASNLLTSARQQQYGEAINTHRRVGEMWGALLDHEPIPPATVAAMMVALKLVRGAKNAGHADSWVDAAAYAAIAAELAEAK